MAIAVSVVKNNLQQSFEEPAALFDHYVIDSVTQVKQLEDGTVKSIVRFSPPNDQIYLKAVMRGNVMCGKATAYTQNGIVFARLSFLDNKLHGHCYFYDKENVLLSEGMYKNGNKDGFIIHYENGIPNYSLWKDNLKVCSLEKRDKNLWCEIDLDGKEIAISELDDQFNRHGVVQEFDENGNIKNVSKWVHGSLQNVIKEFDEDTMTERNSSGEIIYKGGYESNREALYPRSGFGEEFGAGICIYKGQYADNARNGQGPYYHNGWRRSSGARNNGQPHGKGSMLNKEGKVIVEDGDWEYGYCHDKIGWYDYDHDTKFYVPSRLLLPQWVLRGGPVKSLIVDWAKNSKTNITTWYSKNRNSFEHPFLQWDLVFILAAIGFVCSLFSCRKAFVLSSICSFIVSLTILCIPFLSMLGNVLYPLYFLLFQICFLIIVVVVDSRNVKAGASMPATFIVFSVINILLVLGFVIPKEKDRIKSVFKKVTKS